MNEQLLGIDLGELSEWMDTQGLGSGAITAANILSGGTQNFMLRLRRADQEYVLRSPPLHTAVKADKIIEREAKVLAALANTPVPHPKLYSICRDERLLGKWFYLMESIEGFNARNEMSMYLRHNLDRQKKMGHALVDGSLALASVDYCEVGLENFGKPDNYLERQVSRWRSQLEGYTQYTNWAGYKDLPGVEKVANWLEDNRPRSFTPGIMHGDYHIANVMYRYDSHELAAIVDWELTTIGDPLVDLGWMMATWPDDDGPQPGDVAPLVWEGFPRRSELVKYYVEHSSRDCSAYPWYGVLACFKMGIILEGTYARASDGKASMETGERLHGSAIALFKRALSWLE